jgi:hypothetical protein
MLVTGGGGDGGGRLEFECSQVYSRPAVVSISAGQPRAAGINESFVVGLPSIYRTTIVTVSKPNIQWFTVPCQGRNHGSFLVQGGHNLPPPG